MNSTFTIDQMTDAISDTYDAMVKQDWWADEILVILRGGLQYGIMLDAYLQSQGKHAMMRYTQYSKYTDGGALKADKVSDVTPWSLYDIVQKRMLQREDKVERLLIIDDVIETGDTMKEAYKVATKIANEIKIAVLADKTTKSHNYETLYSKKFDPKVWIRFFWE